MGRNAFEDPERKETFKAETDSPVVSEPAQKGTSATRILATIREPPIIAFLFLIDQARLWVNAYLPLDRRNRYIIPVKKARP